MADFLRLINVNAGGFRLKKGQGILHPNSVADLPGLTKSQIGITVRSQKATERTFVLWVIDLKYR